MSATANRELGRKIRRERNTRKLTQQEIATAAGMSIRHFARLENGEHTATDRTIAKIADALGLPVDFFRSEPGQDRASGQAA